jgi:riboflavin kinase / FMN adenylyltransferase
MEVISDLDRRSPLVDHGSVITIGAYDGLHVGHRAIIERVVREARERSRASVLVTFDRHPASLVRPAEAPRLLTDNETRIELLARTGLDAVAMIRFDETQAAESPEDFVTRVLVGALNVRKVVVGEDFCFGRGRRGNVDLLRTMGADLGFEVEGVALVAGHDHVTASSTYIRKLVGDGDVETANRYLGHTFELSGTVVRGDARGRTIGFPTANVEVPSISCIPGDGVYAGWLVRQRAGAASPLPIAVNIGRRPTFYENAPVSLVEAHVIDFERHEPRTEFHDLYDERVRVRFVARLRGEQKFDGIEALTSQLSRDIDRARDTLGV